LTLDNRDPRLTALLEIASMGFSPLKKLNQILKSG